jgi:hypothetical protein
MRCHIAKVDKPYKKTAWCGHDLYSSDWYFYNVEHALMLRDHLKHTKDDRIPCPECVKRID